MNLVFIREICMSTADTSNTAAAAMNAASAATNLAFSAYDVINFFKSIGAKITGQPREFNYSYYQMFGSIDPTPSVKESGSRVIVSGIDVRSLYRFVKTKYSAAGFLFKFFTLTADRRHLSISRFFVPELIYLLQENKKFYPRTRNVDKVINLLIANTWYQNTQVEVPSALDMDVINHLKRKPLPYQLNFIKDIYWQKKTQFHLKGYLLGFDPGLGKSATSLFLKEGLHKKHGIIIAPKSVTRNVWPTEIEQMVDNRKVWVIGDNIDDITKDTDYIIINYEAIDKIKDAVMRRFDLKSLMIIVDECHNFKDIDSQRTRSLLDLAQSTKCEDILLMSGTPIKALGVECIPILELLDTFWTPTLRDQFKALNRYPSVMNELLHNRLGILMFRKLKEEVLQLPDKIEKDLLIKIPDGNKYTVPAVKDACRKYAEERTKYYKQNYDKYEKAFLDILDYYEQNLLPEEEKDEFARYKRELKLIKSGNIQAGLDMNSDIRMAIESVNQYDATKLIPRLPNAMKKIFRDSRTVYKYLSLKVTGEVIGNLLNKLRQEMTSSLIGKDVINIIDTAEKKTILFSDYTDSLHDAYAKCVKAGFKPMLITGENSNQAKELVSTFKNDPSLNPLIASIKCMSTGHTINEANTVIFLNVPYRSTDYEQASDRCYRIGQDTTVYVYRLLLDTNPENNLSTRMSDILKWSREQFGQIVDGAPADAEVNQLAKNMLTGDDSSFIDSAKDLVNVVADRLRRLF